MALKLHLRPRDETECNYLPITTETGSQFCTKCGWVGPGCEVPDVLGDLERSIQRAKADRANPQEPNARRQGDA